MLPQTLRTLCDFFNARPMCFGSLYDMLSIHLLQNTRKESRKPIDCPGDGEAIIFHHQKSNNYYYNNLDKTTFLIFTFYFINHNEYILPQSI